MESKKIYVLCPIGLKTGGPELLHQLVYQINKIFGKRNAVIAYTGDFQNNKPVKEYEKYIGKEWINADEIKDEEKNIVIFPETSLSLWNKYKYVTKYIWWLSVDNYLVTSSFKYNLKNWGFLRTIVHFMKGNIKNYSKQINSADLNLCQSYYAESFLRNKSIPDSKIVYLSDYINDLYVRNSDVAQKMSKNDIILYNPKKGLKFTQRLIQSSKSKKWKWIPLINLTNEEVKRYLEHSKVYIDFGNHPGKDRFPREAAILGCCVLTDKKGAANYYNDVPIKDKYKFEDVEENIPKITQTIDYCINNYNDAILDFKNYRDYIKGEKLSFIDDVTKIFKDK